MFPACDSRIVDLSAGCLDHNKWLGPFFQRSEFAYVTGEYPGDYVLDTAGLRADPTTLEQYHEAGLSHARWGTLGLLDP